MALPPKTILVFCDGTGQDGLITDQASDKKDAIHYTNVLRLSRSISKTFEEYEGADLRLQIVYYLSGVGVASGFEGEEDKSDTLKQAFGTTVAAKIRDAYNFIAQNYVSGDQICIFGFSRGAYTARKVSGLIDRLGLLPPREMGNFFKYWKQLSGLELGTPPYPEEKIPIKCVGTWDTVGSVYDGLWNKVDALKLVDTKLPSNVEIALHAVAFHENRKKFMCTLYTGSGTGQTLKQVWFPGAHSDVGGGYKEHELADVTLAWMVGEIIPFVGIDEEFVKDALSNGQDKRAWGTYKPTDAYGRAGLQAPVVGKANRLGLLTSDSVLHPSLLESPSTQGLITVEDLKNKGWNPANHVVSLNKFEQDVKKIWSIRDRGSKAPVFEGLDELDSIL